MPGFNFVPPVQQLTPEQLAQLGLAAFRPPNAMSMPGMPSAPMGGAQQDMSVGEGMRMLAGGLGALRGMGGTTAGDGTRTGNDADLGGYGGRPRLDASGNPMSLPNPNGTSTSYDSAGNLIGTGPVQDGGGLMSRLFSKLGLRSPAGGLF